MPMFDSAIFDGISPPSFMFDTAEVAVPRTELSQASVHEIEGSASVHDTQGSARVTS